MSSVRASGRVSLRKRRSGPVFYVKFRLPDGRQVQQSARARRGPSAAARPSGFLTNKHGGGPARRRSARRRASRDARRRMRRPGATFAGRGRPSSSTTIEHVRQRSGHDVRDYRSVVDTISLPLFGARPARVDHTADDIEAIHRPAASTERAALEPDHRAPPDRDCTASSAARCPGLRAHGPIRRPRTSSSVHRLRYTGEFQHCSRPGRGSAALAGARRARRRTRRFTSRPRSPGCGRASCSGCAGVTWISRCSACRCVGTSPIGREKAPKSGQVRSAPMMRSR